MNGYPASPNSSCSQCSQQGGDAAYSSATGPVFPQGGFPTQPMSPGYSPFLAPTPSASQPQASSSAQAGVSSQPSPFEAVPAAPAAPSTSPSGSLAPITPFNPPVPVTTESLMYINGYMRTLIGKKVTVDFLIGTNTLVDKTGTLLAVGANYIILNEVETDDNLVCDFYNIKFVHVYL